MKRKHVFRRGVVALLLLLLAVGLDVRLKTVIYEIVTDEVTSPVRLAVLTDLHSCAYGDGQETLLRAVAEAAPDVLLWVGDIVDDEMPEENAWTALSALGKSYPCYYVTGNHEMWGGDVERICAEIEKTGINILHGDCRTIFVNENNITLCGIDDPSSQVAASQFAQIGEQAVEEGYHVLMAHRPEYIGVYLEYPFDLILSGHAHGGQWRIPGILNGVFAPNQGIFPRYAGGRYDFEDTVFVVSRGLARESTLVPRIFNRPELVVVELLPAG